MKAYKVTDNVFNRGWEFLAPMIGLIFNQPPSYCCFEVVEVEETSVLDLRSYLEK